MPPPPPPGPPGPPPLLLGKKKPKKKWTVNVVVEKFTFDKNSKAHNNIKDIDWTTTIGFTKSEVGSLGVIFVSTKEGSIVVKGSKHVAGEYMAHQLSKVLGIYAPDSRFLLTNKNEEGYTAIYNIVKHEMNKYEAQKLFDEETNLKYLKQEYRIQQEMILLMSYINGLSFDELIIPTNTELKISYLSNINFLKQIGHMLCFDMFIHETDRIPTIVNNNG